MSFVKAIPKESSVDDAKEEDNEEEEESVDEEELVLKVVRQPGTGLGISIAGGIGSTPFRGNDEVMRCQHQLWEFLV